MDAPERQEAGQKSLASKLGDATARRPEQHAGRDLDDAEAPAHDPLTRVTAARERQQYRDPGSDQDVPSAQSIVPAVREGGGQREADGGDGGRVGGEARMVDVQDEPVHEPEAFGQRVRAPREEQVLEETHTVRRVEVREDQELDREGERRDERQDERRRHHILPPNQSTLRGKSRATRGPAWNRETPIRPRSTSKRRSNAERPTGKSRRPRAKFHREPWVSALNRRPARCARHAQ